MIRHARNSVLGAAAGLSITVGSFLSGVIVARILGATGAGAYAYAVWIVVMMAPFVDIGLSSAVARYVPELRGRGEFADSERLAGLLLRRLAVSVIVAFLFAAIIAGVLVWSPPWLPQGATLAAGSQSLALPALVVVCVVFQVFGSNTYAFLRGIQDFRGVARVAGLSLIVQITVVGVGSAAFGVFGAVAGYAAGQLVPAVGAFRLIKKSGHLDRELTGRVARYAKFAWAANIASAFVWSRTELFFLERYWGFDAVAMFTVALALSSLATQGPVLLTTGVLSLLSEKRGRNEFTAMREAYEIGTRFLAAIIFPACFGMAAIMPVLLPLIYGPAFSPAIPAAMVLVCVAALGVTTVIATNLVQALERNDFIFFSAAVGAVFAVLAGFVLVPAFGLSGAVATRAAIQILMVAAGTWFVSSHLGYRPPFGSLGRLLAAAIASALVAAACVSIVGGAASLLAAVPAALIVYVLGLRVLRALPLNDLALLIELARAFPPLWARPTIAIVEFLRPGIPGSCEARPFLSISPKRTRL